MAINLNKTIMSEINITPFTDVLLVLLIIFMITTPLIMQGGIPVKLPKSQVIQSTPENSGLTVTITKDDRIFVNDMEVKKQELGELIKNRLLNDPDLLVIIKADGRSYHEWVVDVLDTVKLAGVKRLAIATEFKAEEREAGSGK
jgi:biopolymer transport protein ExbD